MEVPELTRDGHEFINDLLDVYRETPAHKHNLVGKISSLKGSEYGNYKINEMPTQHLNYGELVTDTSKQYYLKARYPEGWEDLDGIDETTKMKATRSPEHSGYYQNECFGEARIWLEAKERGEEHMKLFAPLVDYDGERFSWTVMLKCEEMRSHIPGARDPEGTVSPKPLGWVPHDTESGLYEGRKVAYDYGMWRRRNDEWLVPEEDVYKKNPVFY